jgi:hypothetical protein
MKRPSADSGGIRLGRNESDVHVLTQGTRGSNNSFKLSRDAELAVAHPVTTGTRGRPAQEAATATHCELKGWLADHEQS